MAQSQPSLPTNRAFLAQFRIQATEASPAYAGRVEHVVSGEGGRFQFKELQRKFGFTPESIVAAAKAQIAQGR